MKNIALFTIGSTLLLHCYIALPQNTAELKALSPTIIDGHPYYQVNQSGNYYLTGAIEWKRSSTTAAALTITSSDVFLYLNHAAIFQSKSNKNSVTNAITIQRGVSNVTLEEGTIGPTMGYGILLEGDNENIRIERCTIHKCNAGGVLINGTQDSVRNCYFEHCLINSCTGRSGEQECYGLKAINSHNIHFDSCLFNNNSTTLPSAYGVILDHCNGIMIKNSIASGNSAHTATGIGLFNGCEACIVHNCTSTSNTGTQSYGLYVQNCKGIEFRETKAFANNGYQDAYGFYLLNNSSTFVSHCISSAHRCFGPSGNAYGLCAKNNFSTMLEHCKSYGNFTARGIAAGVCFDNDEQHGVITDCTIRNNNASAGYAYGIKIGATYRQLHPPLHFPTLCDIRRNTLTGNKGSLGSFGIKDFSPLSTNLIIQNTAYGHDNGNFIVTPAYGTLQRVVAHGGNVTTLDLANSHHNIDFQ